MQAIGTDIDIYALRDEFPVLHQEVNGKPLVYFDNAATAQKPLSVIESITSYYTGYNANIHRGVHHLANLATDAFEQTRKDVARLLNAREEREIIFTSGTTDSINLVAQTWGKEFLQAGDQIVVSLLEHHSNIVPWQMLCEITGAELKVIPLLPDGQWDLQAAERLFGDRTRLVAVSHVSNALGVINPVAEIIRLAREWGARVLVDGAQAVSHFDVDVQALDCDFYCFSGHKLYGPTGTGVLYGKAEVLENMPPYRGGGEMIKTVSFSGTTYNDIPHRFEAGTPNIEGVIALGAAVRFIRQEQRHKWWQHENSLLVYATEQLRSIPGMRIFGDVVSKVSVISFLIGDLHPYDVGTLLDKQGIAVRTGHHCTQPLWDHYRVPGTVRASFAVYNTREEVDAMIEALNKAMRLLS
jgi:cysteine desulfurase / selenocysteine lyase